MPGKKKSKKKVKKNASSEGTKTRVTPIFRANIEKAKKYAKHHGEIPTYTCKDKEGIQVFRFLRTSKEYFKKGTLSDEAIGLLDSINGFSVGSRKQKTLEELVNECKEFVETNHRLPREFECSRDKYEATLANFLNHRKSRQGSLSEEQKTLMESIPHFTFQSKHAQNIAQFGTADSNQIRNINKIHKRKAARKAQAKASAELTAQQSSSAKTSVEKYLAYGHDFEKEYSNFNVIKESRPPFAQLGHSSLVPTREFGPNDE